MPECQSDAIERYFSESLTVAELSWLEEHLSDCPDCRAALEARSAPEAFWAATAEFLDTREDFSDGDMGFSWNDSKDRDSERAYFSVERFLEQWLEPILDSEALGRLPKYDIFSVVGEGGMGLVMKAREVELQRWVAIKTIRPQLVDSREARQRFLREARLAASLRHPNIIAIYSVDQWRGVPYLVMPYIEQGTLESLPAEQPPTFDQIADMGVQIANGLQAAHSRGIIHRDIKPTNILVPHGWEQAIITDFGLATAFDNELLTRSGTVAGTPRFMSPEQVRGEAVTAASDLFSFGGILYWMTTGQAPFVGETSFVVSSKIVSDRPIPVEKLKPNAPSWLVDTIDRLLSKSPSDRPASATEVIELLQRRSEASHAGSPSDTSALSVSARSDESVGLRRRRRLVTAVALSTVAMGGLAAAYLRIVATIKTTNSTRGEVVETNSKVSASPRPTPEPYTRMGPLDELNRTVMLLNLEESTNVDYWLTRLAQLESSEVPDEAIPLVSRFENSPDAAVREQVAKILSRNPFETVTPAANQESKP